MRTHQSHPLARLSLPVVLVTLLVMSVLPSQYLRWTDGISQLLRAAVTPISHPLVIVARWLNPADQSRESERIRELEAEARTYELRWRQSDQEINELRSLVADLQSGRSLASAIDINVAAYPVIGNASDVASGALIVRAGSRDGVTVQSTIASTAGTQLVGRVVMAQDRTCIVLPITDRAAGTNIRADIVINDAHPSGPSIDCLLLPADQAGRLAGPATVLEPTATEPNPPQPERGMTVRLRDPEWPRSAQQLIIGDIEEVRRNDDNPLRPWVIVAPRVELRRLGEVILRTPADPSSGLEP